MSNDPFIREKFTRLRQAAKKLAAEYFERYPKDRYQTEVESWRHLQSDNIEFTIKRLREPIESVQPIDTGNKEMSSSEENFAYEKLIAAMRGLAAGKDLSDNVEANTGRKFMITTVLHDAKILQGKFAEGHVDFVKAAFAKHRLTYPGNDIPVCVKALLANGT